MSSKAPGLLAVQQFSSTKAVYLNPLDTSKKQFIQLSSARIIFVAFEPKKPYLANVYSENYLFFARGFSDPAKNSACVQFLSARAMSSRFLSLESDNCISLSKVFDGSAVRPTQVKMVVGSVSRKQ